MFGKLFKSDPKTSVEETSPEAAEVVADAKEETVVIPGETVEAPTDVEEAETIQADDEEDDSDETNKIAGNSDTAPISWNIDKAPTLLITSPEDNPSPFYQTIVAHVEDHSATLDYFAIDLPGTLLENPTDKQNKHVARSLDEAWELSTALLTEIDQREVGKDGKTLLILINEGHKLFKFEDVENTERYSEFLTNMQTVIERGNSVDIKVLMQVDMETAETESRYDFQNAIGFK